MAVYGGGGGPTYGTTTVLRQQPANTPKPSYPSGSTIRAAPDVPAGTYAIVDNGNTRVGHIGEGVHSVERIGGGGGFTAGAVSSVGLTGDFSLRTKGGTVFGGTFFGMNSDPLTDNDYAGIDFAWVNPGTGFGQIYEAGALISSPGGTSDYHWIWRTGTALGYGRGASLAAAQVTPDRTTTSSATLYFDSAFAGDGDSGLVLLADYAAPAAYSLSCGAGSFVLTGQAASLKVGRKLGLSVGAFSLTGQPASLLVARRLALTAGAYTLTGQTSALKAGRKLTLSAGAFTLTGQSAGTLKGFKLALSAGSFVLSGQSAALKRGLKPSLAAGSFILSGQTAALSRGLRLAASAGSYTLAGQAASLKVGRKFSLSPGSFAFTGQLVTLNRGRSLPAGTGAFALTGNALSFALIRRLTAAAGTFALTGPSALFLRSAARMTAGAAHFAFYGRSVTLSFVHTRLTPDTRPAVAALVFSSSPTLAAVTAAVAPSLSPNFVAAATPPTVELEN